MALEEGIVGAPGGKRRIVSYAPASGELLGEAPVRSLAEVSALLERARTAQAPWAERPIEARADAILALRDTIVDHADELVDIVSKECGKPRLEALAHEVAVV